MIDLYEFDSDYIGRKSYVSVRGHSKSIPKYKTYKGVDGYNHLLPEFGGSWDGMGAQSAYIMPDKQPYMSPLDGSYITSRSTHREHMRKHGVVEAGDIPLGGMHRQDRDVQPPISGRDIADAIQQLGGH
jgi:hypothetical protein